MRAGAATLAPAPSDGPRTLSETSLEPPVDGWSGGSRRQSAAAVSTLDAAPASVVIQIGTAEMAAATAGTRTSGTPPVPRALQQQMQQARDSRAGGQENEYDFASPTASLKREESARPPPKPAETGTASGEQTTVAQQGRAASLPQIARFASDPRNNKQQNKLHGPAA